MEKVESKGTGSAKPKKVNPDEYVVVRNGYQGRLVYKSPRSEETYTWDAFGSEQEIQIRELRIAKNSAKKFFINNWFLFDPEYEWVVDYLGVRQYYKGAIGIDDFDKVFTKSPDEIKEIIGSMSRGQRTTLKHRAVELAKSGQIDSLRTISALEEALGVELIER